MTDCIVFIMIFYYLCRERWRAVKIVLQYKKQHRLWKIGFSHHQIFPLDIKWDINRECDSADTDATWGRWCQPSRSLNTNQTAVAAPYLLPHLTRLTIKLESIWKPAHWYWHWNRWRKIIFMINKHQEVSTQSQSHERPGGGESGASGADEDPGGEWRGAVAGAVVEPWRCKEIFYVSVFPGKLSCDHRRLSCWGTKEVSLESAEGKKVNGAVVWFTETLTLIVNLTSQK